VKPVVRSYLTYFLILFSQIIFSFFAQSQTAPDSISNKRPTVGLVLSGGGAKGFAHVGAIKVLEEAGIRPDFIGGTSMGSIIGGLYSIGYSTEYMENMIKSQDWDILLQDKIPRDLLTYEEKENAERLLITFPVSFKGIKMKRGLYTGQNIETLLTTLTSPAYKEENFNDFRIPFLCVGTDLLTGEEVIIENGKLGQAMRASMAIPSFFEPYKWQNRTLVDGGVVNNYPVNRIKEKGADIIIGVDVQDNLQDENRISSMVSILDQISSFYRIKANKEGKELSDYYIKPDIEEFNILDFQKSDSIILAGEKATRLQFQHLKKLADSLNTLGPPLKIDQSTQPLDSILITEIRISGLKKIKRNMIMGKLNFQLPQYIKLSDIEYGVSSIYGTRFFTKVNYSLHSLQNGNLLEIYVEEISDGELGAGFNMNTDYNVALFLNSTFRNIGLGGSKLFVDLIIGEKPRFKTMYLYDLGHKPGFGISVDFHNFSVVDYNIKGEKENKYDITNYMTDVFSQISLHNSFIMGLGAQYKYARVKNDFSISDTTLFNLGGGEFKSVLSAYAFLKIDTYDRNAFSIKGFRINAELKRVSYLEDDFVSNLNLGSATTYYFKYRQNIPVSKRLTLKTGGTLAGVLEDETPLITDWFALGGQVVKHYSENFIPFTGLDLVQEFGKYVFVGRIGLQYNFARKQYLTWKLDVGNSGMKFNDSFNLNTMIAGYGITYGYDSFVGPVELSLMGSNTSPNLKLFVNIGYWF